MASVEPRTLKSAPYVRYWVRWREGGRRGGAPQGEPFDDPQAADEFRKAVDAHGQQWPPLYLPRIGYVSPAEFIRLTSPEPEPAKREPVLFTPFAHQVVDCFTRVNDKTRADYHRFVDLHMHPTFGSVDLAAKDPVTGADPVLSEDVNAWALRLSRGQLDPAGEPDPDRALAWSTIAKRHSLLYSIFNAAHTGKLRLLSHNPCVGSELDEDDEEGDGEMVFLAKHEYQLLRAAAPAAIHDVLDTLAGTGLRFGECTALQPWDLQLGEEVRRKGLHVRRTWKRHPTQGMITGAPKTKTSKGFVSVREDTAAILARNAHGKAPKAWVFTMPNGLPWNHANFFIYYLRALYTACRCEKHRAEDYARGIRAYDLKKAYCVPCGCPGTLTKVPRVHDLRHSHVAWLIAAGVSLAAIQKRLRHKHITTTIGRYGHLLPEVDDELLGALDLGTPPPPPFAAAAAAAPDSDDPGAPRAGRPRAACARPARGQRRAVRPACGHRPVSSRAPGRRWSPSAY
jgi:integrase